MSSRLSDDVHEQALRSLAHISGDHNVSEQALRLSYLPPKVLESVLAAMLVKATQKNES